MSSVARLLQAHPHWVQASRILQVLQHAGHRALLAGGCVRDALLGMTAQDLDIATSATPDEVIGLFPRTVEVGKSFGVIRVLEGEADLEVATFRADGESKDSRRPESVRFTNEKEDALRRDFTVNALFYDSEKDEVLDYVQGKADLAAKVLRTVGIANQRFSEDHLRLLRAVRFAVQLDFQIEEETWHQVQMHAADLKTVSGERVRDEVLKMLKSGRGALGPRLFYESGLQSAVFPELDSHQKKIESATEKLLKKSYESGKEALLAKWLAGAVLENPSGLSEIRRILPRLKLSRAEEKSLSLRLEFLAQPQSWIKLSSAARIRFYDQKETRESWDLLEVLKGVDPERSKLQSVWQKTLVDGKLPEPLLNGHDAKAYESGAQLGELLQKAFDAQLVGEFKDREGALTWLRGWKKL